MEPNHILEIQTCYPLFFIPRFTRTPDYNMIRNVFDISHRQAFKQHIMTLMSIKRRPFWYNQH